MFFQAILNAEDFDELPAVSTLQHLQKALFLVSALRKWFQTIRFLLRLDHVGRYEIYESFINGSSHISFSGVQFIKLAIDVIHRAK